MKSSPYLFIAKFLKVFHPPLPTTPRASKKLVNVLESAFQKHLDEVHPSPTSLSHKDSTTVPDPGHQVTLDTHRHLASLLAHPLLTTEHAVAPKPRTFTAFAVSKFEQVGYWGVRDFNLVQECCRSYLLGLRKNETVPHGGQLAPRLLNWYTQMKPSDKCNFLMDSKTLSLVVPVMYKDGLESEVWNFLRTLYESSFGKSISASKLVGPPEKSLSKVRGVKAEDHLISLMITQTVLKDSLSDAAQLFIQAARYQKTRALDPSDPSTPTYLGHSWHRLAAAILRARHNHQLPLDIYRDVLQYSAKNQQFWTWDSACLEIYHPESPSATSFLQLVRNDQFAHRISLWGRDGQPPRALLSVLLDAADLSQKQGSVGVAQEFLRTASSIFPNTKQPKTLAQAQTQAPSKHSEKDTNLEPLSGLDLVSG